MREPIAQNGAALRHAGNYLSADARKAVEELAAKDVSCFCLSLDKNADGYVSATFGRHWRVLDRPEQLPECLPLLYASLTA